jgi:hypothetical protein
MAGPKRPAIQPQLLRRSRRHLRAIFRKRAKHRLAQRRIAILGVSTIFRAPVGTPGSIRCRSGARLRHHLAARLDHDKVGPIHRMGAVAQGPEACNGWTFRHVETKKRASGRSTNGAPPRHVAFSEAASIWNMPLTSF